MNLTNGAEIIRIELRPGRSGERAWVGKVLAHLPHNTLHPYAVWSCASDDGVFIESFMGDYCETIQSAEEQYDERRV